MSKGITGKVTEEQLMPCQITYEGKDYSPVTHRQVIETLDEYLYKNNFKVKGKEYLAASNGQMAIGKVFIDYPDSKNGYMLAWKNSLNGMMSFGIASGSYTFICSNGAVYGDVSSYKRRHVGTANTEILLEIESACSKLEETMRVHIERREMMKQIEISTKVRAELIGRMYFEDNLLQAEQLGILKGQIENPSFDYEAPGSAWELFQNCTFATRESRPILWHKQHQNLGDWFVNEFGLLVPKTEEVEVLS